MAVAAEVGEGSTSHVWEDDGMWFTGCSKYTCRVRELTTAKVGTLLRISGQVVRTHPVHPELVSGAFICLECQTAVPDVEQQFKFTQVGMVPP